MNMNILRAGGVVTLTSEKKKIWLFLETNKKQKFSFVIRGFED